MIRRLGALGALFAVCFMATAASATGEDAIPLGKLPAGVTPTHYALDFTIDPKADRFSGRAEIAVTFAAPMRAIYLDGLDIHVSEASAVLPDGTRITATYKQVHDSGVVQLAFAREVPAGAAKLVSDTHSELDKAIRKRTLSENTANRYKSRLALALNAIKAKK